MNYSGLGWMNVTWEGVSDGSGSWNGNTYEYDCTVTSGTISITVNDTVGCLNTVSCEVIEFAATTPTPAPSEPPSTEPAGKLYGTHTISNTDGWTWSSADLPLTGKDGDGNTLYYTYYVVEHSGANYNASYDNNDGIVSGTITIKNTESDTPVYTLPETGGGGTTPYTVGGLALMAGAGLLLLYNHSKRRKEDLESS